MNAPLSAERIAEMLAGSPAIAFLNLDVLAADPATETVTMRAPMRAEFEQGAASRQWHGGPIASVIDTVADFALAMLIGHPLPTINLRIDYLRAAIDTSLTVTARVRRHGRSIGVVDTDVVDDRGALVAIGRGTYATTSASDRDAWAATGRIA